MDAAFGWLSALIEWFGKFFPRWILLDSTEGAVKFAGYFMPRTFRLKFKGFDGDMKVTALGPGLHWYWPASTAIVPYPTAFQTDNLPSQTMETEDGVAIAVGGMVSYTVTDVARLLTQTHSAIKLVQVMTLAAIHNVCSKMTWEQLKSENRKSTLDTKLRHAAQKSLESFGVKIEGCELTDLSRTRVYRLIQSTQSDV
jgi:regulator of protease activity HflC (stomatin/prohibitin superfamily)